MFRDDTEHQRQEPGWKPQNFARRSLAVSIPHSNTWSFVSPCRLFMPLWIIVLVLYDGFKLWTIAICRTFSLVLKEGGSYNYRLGFLLQLLGSKEAFPWFYLVLWCSSQPLLATVYSTMLANSCACRMNNITDTNCMSLALPPDCRFPYNVFTVYDTVCVSNLRAAPSPSECCISGGGLRLIRIFIVIVKFINILQIGLGDFANNENKGLIYVYTIWYTFLRPGSLQLNTMSCCANV